MARNFTCLAFLLTTALAACGGTTGATGADAAGSDVDAGKIDDATATTDATVAETAIDSAIADASCKTGGTCGTGEFCNPAGVCCPGLGCGPQCPNGVLLDAKGCETCTCAPPVAKGCNPLSMSPIAQCSATEYCALASGQCSSSQGTCTAMPNGCTEQYQPVCGCDGKTYGNACAAAALGMNVASNGACQPPVALTYFTTCGYPVCSGDWLPTKDVPLCTTEQLGAGCSIDGQKCDAKAGCGQFLLCASSDPKLAGCPKSRAKFKSDVRYVDSAERQRLAAELLDTRLATYRYTAAGAQGPRHLGFMIDDQPHSNAVDAQRDMVDLYGYLSLSVATLQEQQKQIESLRMEVQQLKSQCAPAAR